MTTHVVLGATGAAGLATVQALRDAGADVTSVARTTQQPRPGITARQADLTHPQQTRAAAEDAAALYLTVGLPYTTRAWERDWPPIMLNAMDAALAVGAPLVFLDNVYAYGPVDGAMTEDSPYQPTTRKGRLRLRLIRMLEEAAARGLRYSIVRSADFYGPGASTSVFTSMVADNIAAGIAPVWLFDATKRHSMTYVPDLGRAMAAVGTAFTAQTPNGQVWHTPTAPPLSGAQYAELAAGEAGTLKTMSALTMRLGSPFVPAAREALELSYQSTRDYVFDSARMERAFGLTPTPYAEGIAATVDAARRHRAGA